MKGSSEPATIVLGAINARYRHTSFGLRYLMANLGTLKDQALLVETHLSQEVDLIVEALLAPEPTILGLGVYVWNAARALEVIKALRERRPDLIIVLGGPEVSYEWDRQEIVKLADYTITGEGERAFRELCETLLRGERPTEAILRGHTPPMGSLVLPYDLYTDEDLATRVLYVEASRGCPFRCQFCLSSLDQGVRMVERERFLGELERLLERGARDFKFIDRTFNLRLQDAAAILRFFLERLRPNLSVHFEMVPDRLPDELRGLLAAFPPRVVQLEIGIQSWDQEVGRRIERRQDAARTEANLRFLSEETQVHVHADLIVGLPGEDLETFGRGFDRLVNLGPQEIQVGILKRLRGTPIIQHDEAFAMIYESEAPYSVRSTSTMSEEEIAEMKRFARIWDLVANSGHFIETTALLCGQAPFETFRAFARWLYQDLGRTHAIQLHELTLRLFTYLTEERGQDLKTVALPLARDVHRTPGRKTPRVLKPHLPGGWRAPSGTPATGGLKRQARHAPRAR